MFKVTTASGRWIATTNDYGHALFIARHRVTACEIDGTTVWAGDAVVYYTY